MNAIRKYFSYKENKKVNKEMFESFKKAPRAKKVGVIAFVIAVLTGSFFAGRSLKGQVLPTFAGTLIGVIGREVLKKTLV